MPRIFPEHQIKQILLGLMANEEKLHLARRMEVDRSTIYNYWEKIRNLPPDDVWSMIAKLDSHIEQPKCACAHFSYKCIVCGISFDNIKSEEFQEIVRLRQRVKELEQRLNLHNAVPTSSTRSHIVVSVSD